MEDKQQVRIDRVEGMDSFENQAWEKGILFECGYKQ